jgi:hypothetical protein
MPPELSELWIALCASASQFDDVLEAIDGVDAIVDRSELPELAAIAVEDVDAVVEVAAEVEVGSLLGVARSELGNGKPLAIDEIDDMVRPLLAHRRPGSQ